MEFVHAVWKYLLAAAPYLLLGIVFSGVVHCLISVATIKRHLGAGLGSVLKAALFGIPLPLCSCAVIPAAVTMRKGGAGNGATSSFLISTPESGVDSIALTYAMMDLPMTIVRPLAAFLSSVSAGIAQLLFNDYRLPQGETEEGPSCCAKKSRPGLKEAFRYAFVDIVEGIAGWLLLGILIGAGIDYLVPDEWFANLNGLGGRLAILAVATPMYICASATTPIAASLVLKGMSPGMVLLILLSGPATNSSNILVLQKYIGKKGVFINIVSIVLISLGLSYAIDYIYQAWSLPADFKLGHHHDSAGTWWESAAAVILMILIAKGIYGKHIKTRLS